MNKELCIKVGKWNNSIKLIQHLSLKNRISCTQNLVIWTDFIKPYRYAECVGLFHFLTSIQLPHQVHVRGWLDEEWGGMHNPQTSASPPDASEVYCTSQYWRNQCCMRQEYAEHWCWQKQVIQCVLSWWNWIILSSQCCVIVIGA